MPPHRYSREERYIMVETVLSIMAQHGMIPEATAYQIAKKIDMYPGGSLYTILSEMVAAGRLTARDVMHRPNVEKTIYGLPEGSYQLPEKAEDVIVINGQTYKKERLL